MFSVSLYTKRMNKFVVYQWSHLSSTVHQYFRAYRAVTLSTPYLVYMYSIQVQFSRKTFDRFKKLQNNNNNKEKRQDTFVLTQKGFVTSFRYFYGTIDNINVGKSIENDNIPCGVPKKNEKKNRIKKPTASLLQLLQETFPFSKRLVDIRPND